MDTDDIISKQARNVIDIHRRYMKNVMGKLNPTLGDVIVHMQEIINEARNR